MEQKKMKNDNHDNEKGYLQPIHSQVMKIKKEIEKVKHPSLALQQPEMMRRLLHHINNRRRSRSPLGFSHQIIPVSVSVSVERNSCRV